MDKNRRKIDKRKVENCKWKEKKLQNEERTFFFVKPLKVVLGLPKWEFSTGGKKFRKNDFAPSEKYSSYTLGEPVTIIHTYSIKKTSVVINRNK